MTVYSYDKVDAALRSDAKTRLHHALVNAESAKRLRVSMMIDEMGELAASLVELERIFATLREHFKELQQAVEAVRGISDEIRSAP